MRCAARRRRIVLAAFAMVGGGLVTGCTAATGSGELPEAVVCHAVYTPADPAAAGSAADDLVLTRLTNATEPTSLELGTFVLSGLYLGNAPEGHAVSVRVTSLDGTELTSALYQFDEAGSQLATNFAGGHGFTGLHYVNSRGTVGADADAGSELQFWCEAASSR